MRGHPAVMVVAGAAAAVWCAAPPPVTAAQAASAAAQAGTWGTAISVPGLQALNQSGVAELNSVSCGSAGNCAAGGTYQDSARHWQGFVVGKTNGTWGQAIEVPGLGTLNKGGNARISSV